MFARVEIGISREFPQVVWTVYVPVEGDKDRIVAAGRAPGIKSALALAHAECQRLKLALHQVVPFITTGKFITKVFPATDQGIEETSRAVLVWYEAATAPRKLRRAQQRRK